MFLEGIGVDKNVEKAKEIFRIGVSKNDPNSMYHLAYLLEKTDAEESKKYYKISAELGDSRSQLTYGKMIENDNPDLSIKYLIKASDKNIEAREILAIKYIERNDTENINKYVNSLLETGNFSVPLKYAIALYKIKEYKNAFSYFSKLSEFNHPIANFYIGMMKFRGEGCEVNKKESYEIMKNLSKEGIDRATEFIHMHMQTFENETNSNVDI